MFQFPGFAFLTLWIQVKNTWFNPRLLSLSYHAPNRPRAGTECAFCQRQNRYKKPNNQRLSGGFPHSEIPGSKGILTSPGLIAEYHVLHRLLLPRHPPNALKALDLIQKKSVVLLAKGHTRLLNISALMHDSSCWFASLPRGVFTKQGEHPNIFPVPAVANNNRLGLHVITWKDCFWFCSKEEVLKTRTRSDPLQPPRPDCVLPRLLRQSVNAALGKDPKTSRVLLSERCERATFLEGGLSDWTAKHLIKCLAI